MSFYELVPTSSTEEIKIDNRLAYRAYVEFTSIDSEGSLMEGWIVLTSQNDYPLLIMAYTTDFKNDENTLERMLNSVRWE